MAALIGAYPYDVPSWMPEVLVQVCVGCVCVCVCVCVCER